MPQSWRWDQGRLIYFNFNVLKRISSTLVMLDGSVINSDSSDPLRATLEQQTGLPFSPTNYRVWRNYSRIFKWTLIAANIGNRLVTTDVAKNISVPLDTAWNIDEYLSFVIPRIYFPSPATQAYDTYTNQIFPFCAVLKYLLSRYIRDGKAAISLEDVSSRIVGNGCDGTETIDTYLSLPESSYKMNKDEYRQVRELLIFISQSSFLKWHNGLLHLDLLPADEEALKQIEAVAHPIIKTRQSDPNLEVIHLGTIQSEGLVIASVARENQSDLFFTEGKRVRVAHLRVERSPKLRALYFTSVQPPYYCNMCIADLKYRYPWTDNLLELHHLLPLTSVVKIVDKGTSFDDLVPLCPNCHRSVHSYYRKWLKEQNQEDFTDDSQAHFVYEDAKSKIVLDRYEH